MTNIEFIFWLIGMLTSAIIACQIAYEAIIIQKIKKVFGMQDTSTIFISLQHTSIYLQIAQALNISPLFGYLVSYIGRPLSFILEELRYLLNCPFCLSYHIGWISCYMLFNLDIYSSLFFGFLPMLFVYLYRGITIKL